MQGDIGQLEVEGATLNRPSPLPKPSFPTTRLRLKVQDLGHPGAEVFFANSNPTIALSKAKEAVLSTLYEPTKLNKHVPSTRSVTLILRSMDGVAYTTGIDMDDDHKEIHFSLNYIHDASKRLLQPGQIAAEIQGVLVHEMVHCWQWNGFRTVPAGLGEGIADFVRLKNGLSPPHWKRGGEKWDAGYQVTAYFLEWVENNIGIGSVRRINQALQTERYEEDIFWKMLFGRKVGNMWDDYLRSLEKVSEMTEPKVEEPRRSRETAEEKPAHQD